MTKIAIPISEDEISEQFENHQYFIFYEVLDSVVHYRYFENTKFSDMNLIPEWLCRQNINILLTRRIKRDLVRFLNQRKIQVYVGCSKRKPDEAVHDFIKGELITDPSLCI